MKSLIKLIESEEAPREGEKRGRERERERERERGERRPKSKLQARGGIDMKAREREHRGKGGENSDGTLEAPRERVLYIYTCAHESIYGEPKLEKKGKAEK